MVSRKLLLKGEELMLHSDCTNCHHSNNSSVGPSFLQIASRYEFNETNLEYLSSKIIHGGSGVWGQTPMQAHPKLYKEDAVLIAKYILSQK